MLGWVRTSPRRVKMVFSPGISDQHMPLNLACGVGVR